MEVIVVVDKSIKFSYWLELFEEDKVGYCEMFC